MTTDRSESGPYHSRKSRSKGRDASPRRPKARFRDFEPQNRLFGPKTVDFQRKRRNRRKRRPQSPFRHPLRLEPHHALGVASLREFAVQNTILSPKMAFSDRFDPFFAILSPQIRLFDPFSGIFVSQTPTGLPRG